MVAELRSGEPLAVGEAGGSLDALVCLVGSGLIDFLPELRFHRAISENRHA
jgi:hypothetical protein